MRSRPQSDTEFEKYYQLGHNAKDRSHDQALRYFAEAKNQFNPQRDDFLTYTDLIIDEAEVMFAKKQTKFANSLLQQRLEQVNRHYRVSETRADFRAHLRKMSQICKIVRQQAYMIFEQAEKIDCEKQGNQQKLYRAIDKGVELCVKQIQCAAEVLSRCDEMSREERQQWEQLYLGSLINSIEPLMIQGQKFGENVHMFKAVFKIAEKIDKFYRQSLKKGKARQYHSKSLYFKAVSLMRYSKRADSNKTVEGLLRKDQEFCKQNNSKRDLSATQQELIKLYMETQNFDKVRQLLQSSSQKQLFSEALQQFQKVKKLERRIKSTNFLDSPAEEQIKLIRQLASIIEDNQHFWQGRLISCAREVYPKVSSEQVKFELSYQIARGYLEIKDYINAQFYCQKALAHCNKNTQEHLNVLQLRIPVFQSSQGSDQKLRDIENQVLALSQALAEQDGTERVSGNTQSIRISREKIARAQKLQQSLLLTEAERKMVELQSLPKQVNSNGFNSNQDYVDMEEENFGRQGNLSMMRNQSKPAPNRTYTSPELVLQQKYRNLCLEKNCIARKSILGAIRDKTHTRGEQTYIEIDLGLLLDCPPEQMQIYLQICKAQAWDFRNFRLSNGFLEKFSQAPDIATFASVKLGQVHKLIKCETFLELMRKLENVSELHFDKLQRKFVYRTSAPDATIEFSLGLFNSYKLKILKLKSSGIVDQALQSISQTFYSLVELDMSGNQIKGYNLIELNKLKFLQKLNLSYNPIEQSKFLLNNSLKKLKIKAIRNFRFMTELEIPQIKLIRYLDLSQNPQPLLNHILQKAYTYFMQSQITNLPYLTELRVKKCNITSQLLGYLNAFLSICKNISHLDIRFCHYPQSNMALFEQNQVYERRQVTIDKRAYVGVPYKFKL